MTVSEADGHADPVVGAPQRSVDEPRRASLGRAYALTLASSAGMLVLNLMTGVLSARLLSPDGRGAVGAIAG